MKAFKKFLISFVTLALAVANAASDYRIDLREPIQVGGTELKAGTYKVEIQGDKAVFKAGKDIVAQALVTVETGNQEYRDTMLSTKESKLLAISIGGTKTKLVLKP